MSLANQNSVCGTDAYGLIIYLAFIAKFTRLFLFFRIDVGEKMSWKIKIKILRCDRFILREIIIIS